MEKRNSKYGTNGSTAFKYAAPNPYIHPDERKKREEERSLRKAKIEHHRKVQKRNNKVKLKVYSGILSLALLMGFTLSRGAEVFAKQREVNEMVLATAQLRKENEGLQAKIIKMSAIGNIIQKADELNLVQHSDRDLVKVDLSKNHFSEELDEDIDESSLLEKLFSFIN